MTAIVFLLMRSSSTRWFSCVASIACRKFRLSDMMILYLSAVTFGGLLAVLEVLFGLTFLMERSCRVGFEFQRGSSSLSPVLSLWQMPTVSVVVRSEFMMML
jgi:hypothetical protein